MSAGVLLALCSAFVWGSGDFCGGRATTRMDSFQVLALSSLSGIVMLVVLALAAREPIRFDTSIAWASVAGLATSVGIAALYTGLSIGNAASVAPMAAVTAALLPVAYGALTVGLPRPPQMAGFAIALVGIFLVARAAPSSPGSTRGIQLGVLAGLGFGSFFVLISRAGTDTVYVPLVVARAVMLIASALLLTARRTDMPALTSNPVALLAGVLDAGGTALYLLAQQYVRLDVAAVLSSMYPAATVLLSRFITGEPVTRTQWVGAAVCVSAVALIAA